ncbi:MAG TPA: uracil-DNA glycosylase [Candidatus Kapabacteria bacterium]|nr:uracil-DNA glycosylase [Candidatus Kapabacteria bacterium]
MQKKAVPNEYVKLTKLQEIAFALQTECVCPLKETATQPVVGEGNPDADVFFIGEAPGKNEDLEGRPFIGAAGKILDRLLQDIALDRTAVYITSIEKFRPPNNREPKPGEIMACFPYLEAQITIIEPKLIVTLGRHALRRMLEWEQGVPLRSPLSIDELHGKPITGKSGRTYFPMYHPAAALYNRKLMDVLKNDIKKIPSLLKKKS